MRRGGQKIRIVGFVVAAQLGCAGPQWEVLPPEPELAPHELQTPDSARIESWTVEFTPKVIVRYNLRWSYHTRSGRVRGRASAYVVPPDSMRFDFRAPFGRRGAAVVVGDSLLWAQPDETVARLLSLVRLVWSAFGVARPPPSDATVSLANRSKDRVLRYVFADTVVTYVAAAGPPRNFTGMLSERGRLIGTAYVQLDEFTHLPTTARVLTHLPETLLMLRFESVDTLDKVDPGLWQAPSAQKSR